MSNFKEIVTKAIISKSKKRTTDIYELDDSLNIDNILGCWVINHRFTGFIKDGKAVINGMYDINIWYSYDNNTKTNVIIKTNSYEDTLSFNLKDNAILNDDAEIIVKSLNQPNVIDVLNNDKITLKIEKEMGVEIIGDAMMKISVEDDEDEYDVIEEIEVNDDYLE